MTPNQLAKSGTEHGTQAAFFAWCAVAHLHGFKLAWAWAEKGQAALLGRTVPNVTNAVPALEWMHAIPNGGSRGDDEKSRAIRGGALKAEGVRTGVADVFLPWPICHEGVTYCGLYIEFKKPDLQPKREGTKGGCSDEQIAFGNYARNVGYGWMVCYTWEQAAKVVQQYIERG